MSAVTGQICLVRPRLLDDLASLRKAPLAIVTGPAGAGKTTLLAQFSAVWEGPVGWWQVESGSTGAAVVRGLWGAIPGLPKQPAGDLESLLCALPRASAGEILVIVDDAHRLAGAGAEGVLEAVIARAPRRLHMLVAGRRMLDLNLARYELANVCIVDAEQLRFRSWEVEHLLSDVYREPLPPDDAAALSRRVGGWAAGLHMYYLSTRGRPLPERRRAVAALDGRCSRMRAYLARTVLAELPPELRQFLVRTCVFEVLTAARCEDLLGRPGTSQRYLTELDRRQAFTVTPDSGHTYRYHEVLRAHLAASLAEEVGETAARDWHARAGTLLAADGAYVAAARAFARAEDWASVQRLLALIGTDVDDEGIEPWRDVLPAWLVAEDPWLMAAEGRHLLSRGRLTAAIDCLRSAEEHFTDERALSRCRSTRRLAAIWLPGSPVPGPPHYSSRLREATRSHPALVAGTASDPPLVPAIAHLLAGDIAEVRRTLPADLPDDTGVVGLAGRLVRSCLNLAAGSPHGRHRLVRIAIDSERAGLPWLGRVARAAGALDGSAESAATTRKVVRECDNDGDHWGAAMAQGILCIARSLAPTTEPTDVDDALDLVRRCRQLDAGVLDAWAAALLALAAAAAGLPDAELEAQRAESIARSAGVPGARAAAQAALVRCAVTRLDTACLAAECGLPATVTARWAGITAPVLVQVVEPAPVEVWCFGGFRMRRGGRPVEWSTVKPRTRTALRLLAMHAGRPVHREIMIDALWPGLPRVAATRNLHVALSSLRTFLEPGNPRGQCGLLVRDGDAYGLALPPGGYSDVAEFASALDAARRARLRGDRAGMVQALRTAFLAYGGELLPEDGPAEWVVRAREVLRHRAAEAAVDLSTAALASGDVPEAVAAAERCVEIDRYCDSGWRLLADGYDLLGKPAAAARARRGYADVLASLEVVEAVPTVPGANEPGRRTPVRPRHNGVPETPRRPI